MKSLILKVSVCLFVFGLTFYDAIDKQNRLTRMRMQIPELAKEVKRIQEENNRLQYEIDSFGSPQHLQELLSQSEYSHLKHPFAGGILALTSGPLIQERQPDSLNVPSNSRFPLATGAHR